MKELHPFSRYGLALILCENNLSEENKIDLDLIANQIELGLSEFRMKPANSYEGKEKVKFQYSQEEKGIKEKGGFLSPHVITTFKNERHILNAANEMLLACRKGVNKEVPFKTSFSPTCNEFTSFNIPPKNKEPSIGRGLPKGELIEAGLSTVSTLTHIKPCLQYRIDKKGMPEMYNCCIIPELSLDALINFIKLFKKLLVTKSSNELFIGDVTPKESGKGQNATITYEPKRPLLYRGNFPNPPRSSALGSIALLGAIGEFGKEAEVSELAQKVLDSLKGATIYMIKYGDAKTFTYNHHVIDLAKEGNLRKIVDAVYYSKLYNQDRRTSTNTEYQKFDLFSSHFLQFFNAPAFQDFLAFRVEYPNDVELLLKTYFIKMENIKPEIVTSARNLGKWLNSVAYHTAKREIKEGSPNYHEKIREQKAKVLIELESAAFAAKSGDALIAQVVTRAGRLSGMDAPNEADLFMEASMNGELKLAQAQNMIIAFSRLKSYKAQESSQSTQVENEEKEELDIV
ncbi:type I-PGING CRISPR-associated protein Cas8c/Csp2 [Labilibaculum euxinus]|uniref:Type I-PGING CRISPR-associated protein Cas8c/Csp2 n=1 Tax=Labilibaculum euxinus TaxID=2686357 RepID=A0A7M4D9T2_9BACT|nr:type I-PGING CRISPR-associated protein Cas8c/Csp2 [Labilibaculum euxinus]MUP39411.1 type I-PGING CRISPR-associated protein Cas8c/Csp2 [Labilibaculum euxinus]MVB08616.1 type I-PGING CRISPR-associated protein Cas8c/Csp2 [Labilibaculum euxinus]